MTGVLEQADGHHVQKLPDTSSLKHDLEELRAWAKDFEASHGRPLRVLHLGNIAGNGFLNSKFLRRAGIEADCVCNDYTHVMAMPEWEELDLAHSHGDDFDPVFDPRDTANYNRPDWFIGGPLALCVERVEAKYGISKSTRRSAWRAGTVEWIYSQAQRQLGRRAGNILATAILRPTVIARKVANRARKAIGYEPLASPLKSLFRHHISRATALLEKFDSRFPARSDRLTLADMELYFPMIGEYSRLFAPYDIVQCYATSPIFALISGKKPFTAFEHGTLRHFTTEDHPLHRLTALAYREADHTFITNGDCLAYAHRLGIENYSAVIHPIDVDLHRRDYRADAERIRHEIGADILIYCPIRHDYDIKGTDRAIRALPLIKTRTSKTVKMILSSWGTQVEHSRQMLKDLGCEQDVVWCNSLCRIQMIKHIHAADVVYDQFVLPVFGSTAPQTIAAGKPILASYVPAETAWLISEPAPIVSAFTPQEIAEKTLQCLEPSWRADYETRARRWIDLYHSPDNVIRDHLRVYRRILSSQS